jgi:hypothetical protein
LRSVWADPDIVSSAANKLTLLEQSRRRAKAKRTGALDRACSIERQAKKNSSTKGLKTKRNPAPKTEFLASASSRLWLEIDFGVSVPIHSEAGPQ